MPMHKLYDIFSKMFPELITQVVKWGPFNSGTIKLIMKNKQTLYFMFKNENEWCLGTMKKKETK